MAADSVASQQHYCEHSDIAAARRIVSAGTAIKSQDSDRIWKTTYAIFHDDCDARFC